MEAGLAKNDKQIFYKYLDKCNTYFEYGCVDPHIKHLLEII